MARTIYQDRNLIVQGFQVPPLLNEPEMTVLCFFPLVPLERISVITDQGVIDAPVAPVGQSSSLETFDFTVMDVITVVYQQPQTKTKANTKSNSSKGKTS
jgi:hypothetical protein